MTMHNATVFLRWSARLLEHAQMLAKHSQHIRAMRAVAIADALHWAAGGDKAGAEMALQEARWLKRAE